MINHPLNHIALHKRLIETAKAKKYLSYEEVADMCNLNLSNPDDKNHKLRDILDEINKFENESNRPMLTVVIVHKSPFKNKMRMCGQGFFILARQLGKMKPNQTDEDFFIEELKRVQDYWEDENENKKRIKD